MDLMGFNIFNGDYKGFINKKTGMLVGIRSGKLTVCELENHHFQWVNQVNQLYMAMFNSYVCVPEGTFTTKYVL